MSNKNTYNRSYHLVLQDGVSKTRKVYSKLDIKFKITKLVMPCKYSASISIMGLPWSEMNDIAATSIYDMATAASKFRKRITLIAGYEGAETEIFSGYIVTAQITQPPEMWLNMTAVNYVDGLGEELKESFDKGMTARQILMSVAKKMNIPVVYQYHGGDATKRIGSVTITGNTSEALDKLNRLCNWNIYYDNGFIFASDQPFQTGIHSAPILLNRRNGLLKISNVDFVGCSAMALLNSRATISGYIDIQSEMMPVANGVYWIKSITHEGHFRGNSWYTYYNGLRRKDKEAV